MSQTYTDRYEDGNQSRAMMELIADRGEDPVFLGSDLAPHDASELYGFRDNTQVIVTNAGIVCEDEAGFDEVRDGILNRGS